MNTNQKIAASIVAVATVALAAKTQHDYNQDLYERFPNHDRKAVRKAYRTMMTKAFRGEYAPSMSTWDDTKMDALFQAEYDRIVNKK